MGEHRADTLDSAEAGDEFEDVAFVKHRDGEPLNTLPGDEPVLIEGRLMKRSDHGTWQWRYFMLHGQTLTYYNEKRPSHGASIDLWRVSDVTLQGELIILEITGRKVPRMHRVARSISTLFSPDLRDTSESKYEIKCSSPEEARLWVQAMYSRPLGAVGQWSPSLNATNTGDGNDEVLPNWRRLAVSAIRVVHNKQVLDRLEGVEGLYHGTNFVLTEDLHAIPANAKVELELSLESEPGVVGRCSGSLPQLWTRNTASVQMPIKFKSGSPFGTDRVIVQINFAASSTPRARSRFGTGRKEQLLLDDLDMGIVVGLILTFLTLFVIFVVAFVPVVPAFGFAILSALFGVRSLVSKYILVREMLRGFGNTINSQFVQRQLTVTEVFIAPPSLVSKTMVAAESHSVFGQITTDILASVTSTPSHFPSLKKRTSSIRKHRSRSSVSGGSFLHRRRNNSSRRIEQTQASDNSNWLASVRGMFRSKSNLNQQQRNSVRRSVDRTEESIHEESDHTPKVEYNVVPDASITNNELELIAQLRRRVKGMIKEQLTDEDSETVRRYVDADFRLVRFLRGNSMKVEDAEKQFRTAMAWRISFGADKLLDTFMPPEWLLKYATCPQLEEMVQNHLPRRAWYLRDYDQRLAAYYKGGRNNWKKIYAKMNYDGEYLFRCMMFLVEALTRDMDELHVETGGQCPAGISVVFDMQGFSMSNQIPLPKAIGLARRYLHQFTNAYPELLHKVEVVNAPWLFSSMWSAFTPFIPEEVLEKIHITGPKHLVTRVHSLLPADQVPSWIEGGHLSKDLTFRIAAYGPLTEDGGKSLLVK